MKAIFLSIIFSIFLVSCNKEHSANDSHDHDSENCEGHDHGEHDGHDHGEHAHTENEEVKISERSANLILK